MATMNFDQSELRYEVLSQVTRQKPTGANFYVIQQLPKQKSYRKSR